MSDAHNLFTFLAIACLVVASLYNSACIRRLTREIDELRNKR